MFAHFGVDAAEFLARIHAENDPEDGMHARDLYPDAVPTLERLTQAGHADGIAGNQPERAAAEIEAMGLPVSFVATSVGWGVSRPSPEFFERVIIEADVAPGEITYVGDRLDNDVLPARAAGMRSVLIRRGP